MNLRRLKKEEVRLPKKPFRQLNISTPYLTIDDLDDEGKPTGLGEKFYGDNYFFGEFHEFGEGGAVACFGYELTFDKEDGSPIMLNWIDKKEGTYWFYLISQDGFNYLIAQEMFSGRNASSVSMNSKGEIQSMHDGKNIGSWLLMGNREKTVVDMFEALQFPKSRQKRKVAFIGVPKLSVNSDEVIFGVSPNLNADEVLIYFEDGAVYRQVAGSQDLQFVKNDMAFVELKLAEQRKIIEQYSLHYDKTSDKFIFNEKSNNLGFIQKMKQKNAIEK